MCGRGGRTHPSKNLNIILDMGDNATKHGLWSAKRDWEDLFFNPKKKGNGLPPTKTCPECEAKVHARLLICPYCNHVFEVKPIVEVTQRTVLEVINKGIDVEYLIAKNQEKKDYFTFFEIPRTLAKQMKKIDDEAIALVREENLRLIKIWCKNKKKQFNKWHRDTADNELNKQLKIKFEKYLVS